ncbi:MAG TPA: replication-relaxation family protein [Patescibacteria group bacterium]|nr:replication-relaxation family protein [Patescibacteria group bacterium]
MTQTTITKKQQEILTLLPRFRFLNRLQIQSLLHHKDENRINIWLKDLVENHYIKRLYDNGIVGKNRIPAVFYLDTLGIRFVKGLGWYEKDTINKLYRDKNRTENFRNHCLTLATICTQLEQKADDILKYTYTTETDRKKSDNPYHFLTSSDITIDLCFSKQQKGRKMRYYILTLFDATLPKYRVRKRIRQLREFYFSNDWEDNMNASFPTLLLVCETKERMIYAKRFAKQIFAEDKPDDLSVNFATVGDIKQHGITGELWEEI